MAPTLAENGIKVTLNLDPTDVEVRLNAPRLAQAFLNIIKNAEEAMEGTGEPLLVITSRIEGKSLAIYFIDNGCGIAEKNLEKIFEPYFTTKFHGSGLGLMVVYQIVSEHEGTINVKSAEGKSTTVTILLPISRQPIRLLADK
jgi:signal transduction histidine kinase